MLSAVTSCLEHFRAFYTYSLYAIPVVLVLDIFMKYIWLLTRLFMKYMFINTFNPLIACSVGSALH